MSSPLLAVTDQKPRGALQLWDFFPFLQDMKVDIFNLLLLQCFLTSFQVGQDFCSAPGGQCGLFPNAHQVAAALALLGGTGRWSWLVISA